MSLEAIQADFDRIARLLASHSDRADRYESFLLEKLPAAGARVLDVGCGAGRFTRAIAARGAAVTGIDASPGMIRLARDLTRDHAQVEFVCGDFSTHLLEPGSYDCVVSVATLHHLPAESTLARMKTLLKPGGRLVIHDIRASSGTAEWLHSALSALVNGDAFWWVRQRLRTDRALRNAWRVHGVGERYATMSGVREVCARTLPGATSYRHPLWRYTVVWTKDESET